MVRLDACFSGPVHFAKLLSWQFALMEYGRELWNEISRSHPQYWQVPQHCLSACTRTLAILDLRSLR